MKSYGCPAAFLILSISFTMLCSPAAATGGSSETTPRPSSYDDFVVWDPTVPGTPSLEDFLGDNTHVLIPAGSFVIENPVVIDKTGPLFLHGVGRSLTNLRAANGEQPLFEIRSAERIGFAEMRLEPNVSTDVFTAFAFDGTTPAESFRFELQNTYVSRGGIDVQMPGVYVLQANTIVANRSTTTPNDAQSGVVVDHTDAEVYIVGGKIKDFADANVRQIQGHLEVYGTLFNNAAIDVELESPSPLGAHFVVATRSEGSHLPTVPSSLIHVPASATAIDVVVKSNGFSTGVSGGAGMVDYNAAGTLWMIGNVSYRSSPQGPQAYLATGNAPTATLVAVGNAVRSDTECPSDLFPIVVSQKVHSRNVFDNRACPNGTEEPLRRLWEWDDPNPDPGAPPPPPFPSIPEPPQNANGGEIPLLDMPRMNETVDGLLNVKWFGAKGDGVTDDTQAIQNALDWRRRARVHFPAGTYVISEPLLFDYAPTCPPPNACEIEGQACPISSNCGQGSALRQAGGRIAGAGSDVTVIVNTGPQIQEDHNGEVLHGQVLNTKSLTTATVSGITFRSELPANDQGWGVVHLSDYPLPGQPGPAVQSNSLHDLVFEGGDFGLGVLLDASNQGDATFCGDCEFRGSRAGFVNGGGNAINNTIHGGLFVDNEIAITDTINTASGVTVAGGTVVVLSAQTENVTSHSFKALGRRFYVNDFHSSAPVLSEVGCSSATATALVENSELSPLAPVIPYLRHERAGAFIFLRTTTPPGTGAVVQSACGGKHSNVALLSLFSSIDDWSQAVTIVNRSFAEEAD